MIAVAREMQLFYCYLGKICFERTGEREKIKQNRKIWVNSEREESKDVTNNPIWNKGII